MSRIPNTSQYHTWYLTVAVCPKRCFYSNDMTLLYCHYVRIVSQWINKARLHCALMPKKTAVLRCRTVLVYSPVTINILQRGFHAINTTQTKLFFPMKDPTGKLVCHRILFRGTSRVGNYYHCENSEPAYRTRLFPSCLTV